MKKTFIPALLLTATGLFASCATTGGGNIIGGNAAQTDAGTGATSAQTSVLGNLLSTLLGNASKVTQQDLVGTWQYQAPECVFESESLLAKAGGAVASAKIEAQLSTALAKAGIKPGACSFTFAEDNTYTATVGGRKISGSYEIAADGKSIKMSYLGGLGSASPKVVKSAKGLSLLYESDKLLKLVSAVSALSGSTAAQSLGSLLGNYDGMYVGMKLTK